MFEELEECSFPNNLAPGDTVGALTFVKSLEESLSGDVEAVGVRTIGIKNKDVLRELAGKKFPVEVRV